MQVSLVGTFEFQHQFVLIDAVVSSSSSDPYSVCMPHILPVPEFFGEHYNSRISWRQHTPCRWPTIGASVTSRGHQPARCMLEPISARLAVVVFQEKGIIIRSYGYHLFRGYVHIDPLSSLENQIQFAAGLSHDNFLIDEMPFAVQRLVGRGL